MGINNGWLPPQDFLTVIERSWSALCNSISEEGKVQWRLPVGASPHLIYESDSHEFVTGIFLLAASEMYTLKK